MKKLILMVAVSLLVFASCNDKDDDEFTVTQANIAGTYKITELTLNGANAIPLIDVCERDDNHIFAANGTYTLSDVGVVCTPPGSFNDTWSLTGTTTINYDGEAYTIAEASRSRMVLTRAFVESGISYDIRVVFTRQ